MLELAAPRYRGTTHHGDVAGARTAVDAVGEERVLPDKEVGGDSAIESKAAVICANGITVNALRLLPMTTRGRAHVARKEGAHSGRNVRASHVGTVEKLADEGGKGKGLDVERKVKGVR